jgi:hypothetical protein
MGRSVRDTLSALAGRPGVLAPVDDDPEFVEACLDVTAPVTIRRQSTTPPSPAEAPSGRRVKDADQTAPQTTRADHAQVLAALEEARAEHAQVLAALQESSAEHARVLAALQESKARETQLRSELEAIQSRLSETTTTEVRTTDELEQQIQLNALIKGELATAKSTIARLQYDHAEQGQLITEAEREIIELRRALLAAEERHTAEASAFLKTLAALGS